MFPTYPDLEGRTALVTGASSGIGRGIAQALLHQGMRVSAQHRTQLSPPGTFPVQADLGTERGCVEAVRAAQEKLGNIDLLVHSAGIYNAGPIASISAAALEEMFRVNAFSPRSTWCASCSRTACATSSSSAAPPGSAASRGIRTMRPPRARCSR